MYSATAIACKKVYHKREPAEQARIRAEGEAEAKRISAEAEAEANRKIAESLTPELIEKIKIEQWNGDVPQVQGNGVPILNLE
jgi:regulator of protease activity HflC (stomatin/prohibitin superfamily)